MAYLGVTAKTPEAVNTFGFMLILPLTFMSSTFAPVDTMPGWLQAFVKVNPITFIVDATRGLMLGGSVAEPLWKAIVSLIGIVVVFAPLAVARYRKRV
jgi:ABC-type multidrug transport system permease subunit